MKPLCRSSAAEGLPRRAAGRHRHAPEQGAAAAAAVRVGQQGVPALAVPHHQDVLLRSGRVPHPTGRRPAGHLLRLLGLHGGPQGQHGAGHPGWVGGAGGPQRSPLNNPVPSSVSYRDKTRVWTAAQQLSGEMLVRVKTGRISIFYLFIYL